MADNTQLNLGTGGDLIASDDIAGVKHQRVKIEFGADGVATDVSPANPLPISVSTLPLPTGAAQDGVDITSPTAMPAGGSGIRGWLSAIWTKLNGTLNVSGTFFQATQPISATTLPLPTGAAQDGTDINTPTAMPTGGSGIRGWLSAIWTKLNGSLAVTGTFFQATQPISGTVSTGLSQPLTDTQLRSTPVPVTMSNTLALTDTQIRATPLPVSVPAEGVVSTVNSSVVNLAANAVFTGTSEDITVYSNVKVNVYSSHASATDGLSYQQSHDGVLWLPMDVYTIPAVSLKSFSTSTNMKFFRVVYTNGATATTQLVIQVLYHKSDKQPSSVKPQDGRANDNDFVETLGFLMGYNGTSWDRIRSSLKGVQGLNALNTQDLKDSGRSHVTFYSLIPVLSLATDTLQSLTGTRAGVTVAATTTPAVVNTGKTFRVTKMSASYIATGTSGYAMVRLRFNTAGVVAIGSPVATTLVAGSESPITANAANTIEVPFSEGMEFSAGTGIGISVQGFAAVTPTAVGYILVSISGYEY